MSERTGSVRSAAKGYGRNMVKLNSAQAKMRETFLESHKALRKMDPDTSEFCYICDRPGDNRQPDSFFSTVIPIMIPGHPERGLQMDGIYGIWVCGSCSKQLS